MEDIEGVKCSYKARELHSAQAATDGDLWEPSKESSYGGVAGFRDQKVAEAPVQSAGNRAQSASPPHDLRVETSRLRHMVDRRKGMLPQLP